MKIGVTGANGRVGGLIISELHSGEWPGLKLASALSRTENISGLKSFTEDSLEDFVESCECIIDFSKPDLTLTVAKALENNNKYLITGTTGLSKDQENDLVDISRSIPVLYAANMSLGLNLMLSLVEKAAQTLGPDWDIEISETHHKHKIDAPSGTAIALGNAAAKGRDGTLEDLADHNRHGITGEREWGKIGFAVQRGGDVVGEHEVTFYGQGERISLGHIASDRRLFARGALKAAQWIKDKPPGLYTMKDVLGL